VQPKIGLQITHIRIESRDISFPYPIDRRAYLINIVGIAKFIFQLLQYLFFIEKHVTEILDALPDDFMHTPRRYR
jgi:hypothetical protein